MLAFIADSPPHGIHLSFRSSTAATSHQLAWRRVDCKREEVRWFRIVGNEALVREEIYEYKDVREEKNEENDEEGLLVREDAAGGVLLGADCGIEVLVLRDIKRRLRVILENF